MVTLERLGRRQTVGIRAAAENAMKTKRWAWAICLVVGLAAYAALEWTIDDWNRDLVVNSAATSVFASDSELLPVTMADTVDAAERAVLSSVLSLDGYEFSDSEEANGARILHLTHTSPLLKAIDDITVSITNDEDTVVIHAFSESRSPWGDLGRNPRNLKKLLGKIREILWAE
jgi:uncharacterized protein (DUF1499 family)